MSPLFVTTFSRLRNQAVLALLGMGLVCARAHSQFDPAKLTEMDAAITNAIAGNRLPGGVLWLEREGRVYQKAFGHRALVPGEEPMTLDTIFDAASLTKVAATTPAIMLLIEREKVTLSDTVREHIPEFRGEGTANITIRHLMTHTSGLRPGLPLKNPWTGYEMAIQLACMEPALTVPGTALRYSDINFILLGEIVQRAGGRPLNEFVAQELYAPLKMDETGFLPSKEKLERMAPTEMVDEGMLRGVVHDPTARRMGGVAGHAGLFTTAADLARYARALLNRGELEGVRVFRPETIELMTSVQTAEMVPARRGLGWDIDSSYSGPRGKVFPLGSYGHTGWTGTSLWVDPFSRTFLIFLSNRNHPDGKGSVLPLRAALGTLAAEAVREFDFKQVAGALPVRATNGIERAGTGNGRGQFAVLNGIDVLKRQNFGPLKKLRIGLITNHTGRDRERNSTIDLLDNAPEVQLKALFSPEHGIRGVLDEAVGDTKDQKTGLPIYSLYGAVPKREPGQSEADYQAAALRARQPRPEQLKDLDALVFDIQDIGCRFYTYISTMGGAMDAAAKAGIRMFVLDRVNPINGVTIEGPVMTRHPSFIGYHPIPVRHGMTVGELARMFNEERAMGADLTVIPVEGWTRAMWLDQTGLPWINPSPNMRSLTEATLYPGVGLVEYNPVSVGRGTDTPFEWVGAPYIDDLRLDAELSAARLSGVRFVPVRFTPNASVFKNQECGGVNFVLTDRDRCNVVEIGIVLAQTLHRLYPDKFEIARFSKLLGHEATLEAIKAGKALGEIKRLWEADLQQFKQRREKYLLYR